MTENRFIEKFKYKSKSELEDKISNPKLFNPEAIFAAKYVLDNFNQYQNEKKEIEKSKQSSVEKTPIFKDKAIFKNKWIYRLGLFFTLILTLSYSITFNIEGNFEYLIWSIINGLFFIVLLSKHRETVYFLNILSTLSLLVIYYRYLKIYINLGENQEILFSMRDIKYVGIYVFLIFGGKLLVEIKRVQVNK